MAVRGGRPILAARGAAAQVLSEIERFRASDRFEREEVHARAVR